MKKFFCVVLALALCSALLAACNQSVTSGSSSGGVTSTPQDVGGITFPLDEPITLNVFSWYQGDFDPENPLVKEFERLTNVKLVYNAPADGYEEKESLILTSPSKEWPDVMLIGVAGGKEVTQIAREYGQAGRFVCISDYLDAMPNVKAYYEEYPDSRSVFEDADGKTYIFPYIYPYRTIPTGFFVNQKAFDANNIPVPTSAEEIYEAAKQLKAAYPNSYPVTSYTIPETLTVWARVFSTASGIYFNQQTQQYEYGPFSKEYRQMLEYLNKLYSEELYDPQFPQYVFAGDDWRQTLASGKSFITESYVWEMQYENTNSVNSIARNMNLQDTVEFSYITPPSANGVPSKYWGMTTVSQWYGLVINSESPYVNEILALLDWHLSDAFFNLLGYGIEGVTYTMENGTPTLMDGFTTTGEEGKTPLSDYMSFYAGFNLYEIYPDPLGWKSNLEDFTGYTMDEMADFASWPVPWTVLFDQDTRERHSLVETPASTTLQEMSYKFIIGTESFDNYERFLDTLKGYGIEDVVADYNAYYAENIA